MSDNSFIVKADFREDNSNIPEILIHEYKIKVIRKNLRVGDYHINDEIVLERKTTQDFVQSIIDGRLFRQAVMMRKHFDRSLFIVEGGNIRDTPVNIHPHAVKGALVSISLAWQIPVLFTENTQETALLLWLIGNQRVAAYQELSWRPGRRPKGLRKKQIYILQGIPHVGPKLAAQLLGRFGTVKAVITASDNDLMKIPGLGKIKAKKIREVVSKDFHSQTGIAVIKDS